MGKQAIAARRGRALGLLTALLVPVVLAACGSKSPLYVPDPIETDAGTDAGIDSGPVDSGPPDGGPIPDECIELPFNDPPSELQISFVAQILSADVFFLVDVTGSMGEEIGQIQTGLRETIIPGLAEAIPDVRFGVGYFADFPIDRAGYGSVGDEVFRLLTPMTGDISRVQRAVDDLPLQSGGDTPEAMTEALFAAATGRPLGEFVPPSSCGTGTVGYPCFRGPPVILAFTDAPTHNGPRGTNAYRAGDIRPSPHTYDDAVTALRMIGAKVLGLNSGSFGDTGRPDLESYARDTGAIRPDGTPIVFDIGTSGSELGVSVVEAIRTLVDEVPLDVDVLLEDYPGDAVDTTSFVESVVALSASPADGAVNLGDRFADVRPGTRVTFQLLFFNGFVEQTDEAQSFFMNVVLRGDGVVRLQETLVQIIVPPRGGGTFCTL